MMCEFAKNSIHLLILNTNYAICFRHALYCIIVRHLTISLIILLLRGAYMCNLFQIFTPQPSGLEGYCHNGPGGRPDGRLPDLRNLYLCNRLMDYLHSKFCGIVWACHRHLPICPLWPCPWANNLSNLPQTGSRHCGTHVSQTVGWIYPFKISWTCLDL